MITELDKTPLRKEDIKTLVIAHSNDKINTIDTHRLLGVVKGLKERQLVLLNDYMDESFSKDLIRILEGNIDAFFGVLK